MLKNNFQKIAKLWYKNEHILKVLVYSYNIRELVQRKCQKAKTYKEIKLQMEAKQLIHSEERSQ